MDLSFTPLQDELRAQARSFLDATEASTWSQLAELGWKAKIPLRQGLADAYADFLQRDKYAERRLAPGLIRSAVPAAE